MVFEDRHIGIDSLKKLFYFLSSVVITFCDLPSCLINLQTFLMNFLKELKLSFREY